MRAATVIANLPEGTSLSELDGIIERICAMAPPGTTIEARTDTAPVFGPFQVPVANRNDRTRAMVKAMDERFKGGGYGIDGSAEDR
jgi:hypothetical protein